MVLSQKNKNYKFCPHFDLIIQTESKNYGLFFEQDYPQILFALFRSFEPLLFR